VSRAIVQVLVRDSRSTSPDCSAVKRSFDESGVKHREERVYFLRLQVLREAATGVKRPNAARAALYDAIHAVQKIDAAEEPVAAPAATAEPVAEEPAEELGTVEDLLKPEPLADRQGLGSSTMSEAAMISSSLAMCPLWTPTTPGTTIGWLLASILGDPCVA
jgi:hypothetical protein